MPDDDTVDGGEDFDAAAAFYAKMTGRDGEEVHNDDDVADPDDDERKPDADPVAGAQKDGEAAEGDGTPDPDDAEVAWGDAETPHKAKMRELKAAFLERAATESLKAETTTARERAVRETQSAVTALTKLVERAKEAYKPYETFDWYAAMRDLSPEEFDALRADAGARAQEVKFLTSELGGLVQAGQQEQARVMAQQAQAAIKELSDPETGIPNFGKEVWGNIRDHAIAMGAAPAAIDQIVDPWAIRIIYQSMLYKTGAKAAAEKIAKVVNKPTHVTAPSMKGSPGTREQRTALSKIRGGTKDSDAIAEAFFENLMKRDQS